MAAGAAPQGPAARFWLFMNEPMGPEDHQCQQVLRHFYQVLQHDVRLFSVRPEQKAYLPPALQAQPTLPALLDTRAGRRSPIGVTPAGLQALANTLARVRSAAALQSQSRRLHNPLLDPDFAAGKTNHVTPDTPFMAGAGSRLRVGAHHGTPFNPSEGVLQACKRDSMGQLMDSGFASACDGAPACVVDMVASASSASASPDGTPAGKLSSAGSDAVIAALLQERAATEERLKQRQAAARGGAGGEPPGAALAAPPGQPQYRTPPMSSSAAPAQFPPQGPARAPPSHYGPSAGTSVFDVLAAERSSKEIREARSGLQMARPLGSSGMVGVGPPGSF